MFGDFDLPLFGAAVPSSCCVACCQFVVALLFYLLFRLIHFIAYFRLSYFTHTLTHSLTMGFTTPDGKEFDSKKEWRKYMYENFFSFSKKVNEPEPLIKMVSESVSQ